MNNLKENIINDLNELMRYKFNFLKRFIYIQFNRNYHHILQ